MADDRRLFRLESVARGGRQRGRVDGAQRTEDHRRAYRREQRGSQRIECLRQRQSTVRSRRVAEMGDQRVGSDLKHRDAACQHKQRAEEGHVKTRSRRRNEQQAPRRHQTQPEDDTACITDAADQPARRKRHHRIGGEEGELGQHRLGIGEREQPLELGDQDVVETGEPTPQEEQRHHRHHDTASRNALPLRARRCGHG